MRVLIFQTPKLTYVQTLEYLLRETNEQKVDFAVLPEFSLEHPAQCTNQSELSYDNVSIMMLSRVAKQRQLYLVLGSVEERCPYGVFDTCVVSDLNTYQLFLLSNCFGLFLTPKTGIGVDPKWI